MARHSYLAFLFICASAAICRSSALAAVPSEQLMPYTTKGFLSIPDTQDLSKKWDETQLGHLVNDPVMQPFVEDLKRQLKGKLSQSGTRLGITLEDLDGIAGGEVALAVIQPGGDKKQHAIVAIVDISGHEKRANELLAKIHKNQLANGAKQTVHKHGGVDITVYTLPKKKDQAEPQQAFYLVHQMQLVATDHLTVAEEIVGRFDGKAEDTLAAVKAFEGAMQHCVTGAGELKPHVRWFVEPFGYTEVTRASTGGRKKRGTDLLKVLAKQGFTAVQGLGGFITFATGEHEILHRTFIFAPANGIDNAHKYQLAARVLDFPNKDNLAPLPWIPRDLAVHMAFNWKIKEGFEFIGTLVDDFAGDKGVFEDVLLSLETDPNGPRINIRKELVAYSGERVTLLSDHRLPINPKCERLAIAVEVTDMKAVAKAMDKIMESDPNATKHEYKGHTIWEIINDDQAIEVEELQIDDGFTSVNKPMKDDKGDEKPIIPNAAVTVMHGHLVVATHLDFVRDLLNQPVGENALSGAADYALVDAALVKLGAGTDSFRHFVRTDEAYRPTYELVKQGKMPQAETLMGKLLNNILAPDEEGTLREQEIDGTKMPDYQAVRRYLGPAGLYVRTVADGWSITGCLLSKEAEKSVEKVEQPAEKSDE